MDMIPQGNTPRKQCAKCKEWKIASTQYFHSDKERPDKLFPYCKKCRSKKKPSDIESGYRRCSRCKEVFPETLQYFQHTPRTQNKNLTHACKTCLSKGKKAQYQAHIEERRVYLRDQHAKHREQRNAQKRRDYAANPQKYYRWHLSYTALPHVKAQISSYYTQYYGEYIQRPGIRARLCAYSHNRRTRIKGNGGTYTVAQIQAQYDRQQGKCYYCRISLRGVYHVDHVIPVSRGGSSDISNLVVSCPSCNLRKGYKLPHEWIAGGRLL